MSSFSLFFVALLGLGALAPAAARHPSDGPDVDVRVLVGNQKVTLALVLNLAFVDEIVDYPREVESEVHDAELEGLEAVLLDHFADSLAVAVDGVRVTPVARELSFEAADPSLVPLFLNFGELALARVQLLLDYSCKARPGEVSVQWGDFPPNLAIQPVRALAEPVAVIAQFTARGVMDTVTFTKDAPTVTWRDPGEGVGAAFEDVPEPPSYDGIPFAAWVFGVGAGVSLIVVVFIGKWIPLGILASLGCLAGAFVMTVRRPLPLPTEAQALAVFGPLHANIYRAFDYVDEGEIYDALARSVDGPLLDELYNQVYRSLVIQEAGGAVSHVDEVRVRQADVTAIALDPATSAPRFEVDVVWEVDGSVFHFGHAHRRTHEYRAQYGVAVGAEGWRIASHEIRGQRRLRAEDDVVVPPSTRTTIGPDGTGR